ncbi:hypothetical protein V8E36_004536 [Tilletia maclaganii]
MSSYRSADRDRDRPRDAHQSSAIRPSVAASALYRSAAANQTLNIDKFRPRSPTPERDPDIVAYLAAQEASGSTRDRRKALTAEENRARREREAASAAGPASASEVSWHSQTPGTGSFNNNSSSSSKTRYQREKEEAERKAKEADEAAARAYEEFSAEMSGPRGSRYGAGSSSSRSWYGNSTVAPSFVSASRSGGPSGESSAAPYIPARSLAAREPADDVKKTGSAAPPSSGSKTAFKRPLDMFGDDAADEELKQKPVKAEPPGKRMRAMEDFLGQLQRDQKAREERFKGRISDGNSLSSILAFEGQRPGSKDQGDPLTTNVCVLNLPANITEESLGSHFCQWGDIGSVKIMWPRGDELGAMGGAGAGITMVRRMQSSGLTGFVSFMRRADAENAIKQTDSSTWGGSLIKTGWGKAMPIPSRPQFYAPKRKRQERSASPSSSRRPRGDAADAALRKSRSSRPKLPSQMNSYGARMGMDDRPPSPRTECRMRCEAKHPSEASVVRTVAQRIQQHGPKFEEFMRAKERDNPVFSFLWDEKSISHQYFQLCLNPYYEPQLPLEPFTDEGDAAVYSSDSGEDSEAEGLRKQRRDVIGPAALRRFEAMLRGLTPRRERIARCMIFALDHAHACEQVVDILCDSLLIPSTPIPRKLARLHVVSDILHNSANPLPNVWKYRMLLEKRLPEVFEHLGDVGRSFSSRMKAESWKQMVGHVLSAWEAWLVFPSGVLEGLAAALLAPAAASTTAVESQPGTSGSGFKRVEEFDEDDEDGEVIDPSAL